MILEGPFPPGRFCDSLIQPCPTQSGQTHLEQPWPVVSSRPLRDPTWRLPLLSSPQPFSSLQGIQAVWKSHSHMGLLRKDSEQPKIVCEGSVLGLLRKDSGQPKIACEGSVFWPLCFPAFPFSRLRAFPPPCCLTAFEGPGAADGEGFIQQLLPHWFLCHPYSGTSVTMC